MRKTLLKKMFYKLCMGVAAAGLVFGGAKIFEFAKDKQQEVENLTMKLEEKIVFDLLENTDVVYLKDATIDISNVHLNNSNNLVGETENSLDFVGVINNGDQKLAFKSTYTSELMDLKEELSNNAGFNTFLRKLSGLLDEMDLQNISVYELGLVNEVSEALMESDMFTNVDTKLSERRKDYKAERLPMFTTAETSVVDGKVVATVRVDSLEDEIGAFTNKVPYQVNDDIFVFNKRKLTSKNSSFRRDAYTFELPADREYSEEEILQLFTEKVKNNDSGISFDCEYYAENLLREGRFKDIVKNSEKYDYKFEQEQSENNSMEQ